MTYLFQIIALNKHRIIRGFWAGYGILVILFLAGGYSILTNNANSIFFYLAGKKLGDLASITFCILLLPGIARRFDIRHRWVSVIMWFRRQLGISVFLLGIIHYLFVRGLPRIANGQAPLASLARFELFGLAGLILLFPLFLTSNDASMRLLKKQWYTLHTLVYVVAWLIFGHVIFQRLSVWSAIVGIAAFAEIISHIYQYTKSRHN